MRIQFNVVCDELTRILLNEGFEEERAKRCATIFTENTCDGIVSHGLNRFPYFIEMVRKGFIDVAADPVLVRSLGAIEQWDGGRGAGPLNAEKSMSRAIELSQEHGIGCVGLRNTNHWMRGGTYGLQAAGAGCIGVCWTNTLALMPSWGSSERKIGNNPMVVCIPYGNDPVLLDMAMSQFSYGKIEVLKRRGEQLPFPGGYDKQGELTTDPGTILDSFMALPIGYWKGSGLALVLDLLASLISDGDSTSVINEREQETGVSQVFIAIDTASGTGADEMNAKVHAVIEDFLDAASLKGSTLRYPGQGMIAERQKNIKEGIPVDPGLWQSILGLR